VDRAFEEYRFADAAQALQRFVWSELCDWALEMEKGRLYEASADQRHRAAGVVAWVLERSLRLLHPIMPFVTEEVWQRFSPGGTSIVLARWPEEHPEHHDADIEDKFQILIDITTQVRRNRALVGQGSDSWIMVDAEYKDLLEPVREALERLTGDKLLLGTSIAEAPGRFMSLRLGGLPAAMSVPERFAVTPALAARRKRLADVEAKLAQSEAKLGNESFLSRAKAEAVERERTKHGELTAEGEAVRQQIQLLEQFGS